MTDSEKDILNCLSGIKLYKFRKGEVLQWMTAQKGNPDNLVDDYVNRYLQKHLLKG